MLAYAPFWLAGVAIIALTSLWARANRRSGWRRERSGAEVTTLRELMELPDADYTPVIPLAPLARPQPPVSDPDPASLLALEAALGRAPRAQQAAPQKSPPQTADEHVEVP